MKLSELKSALRDVKHLEFALPNGELVPPHFHVTEIGEVQKRFIDCGGTLRKESAINFQLFTAEDFDHRLSAEKLISIIELSERQLELNNLEIEVEYQSDTIGKYFLGFDGTRFQLEITKTDCLAKDNCGIPQTKRKVKLSEIKSNSEACVPGSGCC